MVLTVLMKALVLFLIIVGGYLLKRIGFFKPEDFRMVSRIVLKITLPAAIVSNFSKLKPDLSMAVLIVAGILCNLLMIALGYMVAGNRNGTERAFHMINFSGYNIGCFSLPYVQSFLGPGAVVAACLFDAGNALLCTGGTYSLAALVAKPQEANGIRRFFTGLLSSVPVMTYVVMLVLAKVHLSLPEGVRMAADTVGAANTFLAMLMIGIGFELHLKPHQRATLVRTLAYRYGVAALLAMGIWFLIPDAVTLKPVLLLLVFSPLSAVCTAFTERCGGDVGLSASINSASILISMTVMTALMMGLHLV